LNIRKRNNITFTIAEQSQIYNIKTFYSSIYFIYLLFIRKTSLQASAQPVSKK